jgi:hypothetical protein
MTYEEFRNFFFIDNTKWSEKQIEASRHFVPYKLTWNEKKKLLDIAKYDKAWKDMSLEEATKLWEGNIIAYELYNKSKKLMKKLHAIEADFI